VRRTLPERGKGRAQWPQKNEPFLSPMNLLFHYVKSTNC
jgi:hypothetical protein